MLYMFRTPLASNIRSTINCNSSHCSTDLGHQYRIYSIPTYDKHQWLLLQFIVLLMMDAKGVRNMQGIPAVVNKHNTARVASCWFFIYYSRGELCYLAPLGSENISAPYFKQCFFQGGVLPPRQSNTTPPNPKTEITNILFYILNFASIIKFKM